VQHFRFQCFDVHRKKLGKLIGHFDFESGAMAAKIAKIREEFAGTDFDKFGMAAPGDDSMAPVSEESWEEERKRFCCDATKVVLRVALKNEEDEAVHAQLRRTGLFLALWTAEGRERRSSEMASRRGSDFTKYTCSVITPS
jgi:hypothetical protein